MNIHKNVYGGTKFAIYIFVNIFRITENLLVSKPASTSRRVLSELKYNTFGILLIFFYINLVLTVTNK